MGKLVSRQALGTHAVGGAMPWRGLLRTKTKSSRTKILSVIDHLLFVEPSADNINNNAVLQSPHYVSHSELAGFRFRKSWFYFGKLYPCVYAFPFLGLYQLRSIGV